MPGHLWRSVECDMMLRCGVFAAILKRACVNHGRRRAPSRLPAYLLGRLASPYHARSMRARRLDSPEFTGHSRGFISVAARRAAVTNLQDADIFDVFARHHHRYRSSACLTPREISAIAVDAHFSAASGELASC